MSATDPGTTKRIDEISMLKGLGILFVIVYHMAIISGVSSMSAAVGGLQTSVGLPVMIMFYMVSGYTNRANKPGALIALRARTSRILGPYYLYSALMIAVLAIIYLCVEGRTLPWFSDGSLGILFQLQAFHYFDRTIQGIHPMFYSSLEGWFLFQLVVSEVLFIPLLYVLKYKKKIIKIVVAAALLLAGALLYVMNLQGLNGEFFPPVCKIFILPNIPGIAALLLIGNYMAEYELLDLDRYSTKAKVITASACLVVIGFFAATDDFLYDFPIGKWGAFGAYSFILSPINGAAFLLLFGIILNFIKGMEPVKKVLIFTGDNSMDYLILHFFIGFLTAYIGGFWFYFIGESFPDVDTKIRLLHFAILLVFSISVSTIVIKLKMRFKKIISKGERNG